MAVYVDQARNRFRGMVMCHMIADTLEELHAMADAIGLKREWFQDARAAAHYDLSLSHRRAALANGAIELERRSFVVKMRELRA